MSDIHIKHFIHIFLFAFFCVTIQSGQSFALDALKYDNNLSTSLRFQIDRFLAEHYKSDSSAYDIASTDLNKDGIFEHILRRKSCDTQKDACTHIIIAEKKDRILLLSKISARNLMIDSKFSYGIKNILAFKSEINDYDFDIYMWSPEQKLYIIAEQQTED